MISDTTEECHTLRDKIEELIRQGHLKKYIQKDRLQRSPIKHRSPAQRQAPTRWEKRREQEPKRRRREPFRAHLKPEEESQPEQGYINTISGGSFNE